MSGGELTADQIRALLHELGRRLRAQGVQSDIKLVGGAALILQGIGNRPTADIDASYADPAAVNAVATEMAADYDLAPDWLNSNAAAFVPDNATWSSTTPSTPPPPSNPTNRFPASSTSVASCIHES